MGGRFGGSGVQGAKLADKIWRLFRASMNGSRSTRHSSGISQKDHRPLWRLWRALSALHRFRMVTKLDNSGSDIGQLASMRTDEATRFRKRVPQVLATSSSEMPLSRLDPDVRDNCKAPNRALCGLDDPETRPGADTFRI